MMSPNPNSEIITAAEALRRVGLEGLLDGQWSVDRLVEWTGYPKPFSCGHTAVYGFGPVKDGCTDADAGRRGSHRAYQALHCVSQFCCSGPVLFSWPAVARSARGDAYYISASLVVSIDELPDDKSTALRACWPVALRSVPASARLLVGRRIVTFELGPFSDGRGGTAHRSRIALDNGVVLYFVTEETDTGDYGVSVCYARASLDADSEEVQGGSQPQDQGGAMQSEQDFIDIVFDGPPGHESGRFVEIEDSAGRSIRFGDWVQRPDGYWALRVPAAEYEVKHGSQPQDQEGSDGDQVR